MKKVARNVSFEPLCLQSERRSSERLFFYPFFFLQIFEFKCALSGGVVADDLAVAEDLVLVGN